MCSILEYEHIFEFQIGSCVIAVQKLVAPSHLSDRLNYLQCQMFDDLMRVYNYSPQSQTIPHGSALSMLGTSGGDLDMCMHPYGLEGYYCQPGGHEVCCRDIELLHRFLVCLKGVFSSSLKESLVKF